MSDYMKNIVRSAFEHQSSESAPNSIWSAIHNELALNEVDVAIKESFEGQQGKAPEMVWERVQNQLDIERVWTRIASKIQIRRYGYVLRYACAVLLLLIPFALDFNNVEMNSSMTSDQGNRDATTNPSRTIEATNREQSTEQSNSIQSTATVQATLLTIPNTPRFVNVVIPKSSQEIVTKEIGDLAQLKTRPVLALNQPQNLQLQPFFNPKPKRSLGLIVGGVSSLDNTWIIDNETRSGFDDQSLVENEISMASSYGAFAEYQINRRYSIFAEYLFQSRTRQHALVYNESGKYIDKLREINTYKLAFLVTRYSQPKFNGISHSTLLRFGGYMSGVKNDFTTLDGVITNVNSVYKRHDIGLRAEIGKRIYLRSFVIEGGIKTEFGLANLASFKSNIPPQLNFTRLVSGGAYIRLGYSF